ncbi:MAG TPA: GNAT family N-acetyltransferase [Candidatus Acidoferrum sp.]|nr:GNAT family N-acetyltransferase [Candidatus Acidoferrum sp.]
MSKLLANSIVVRRAPSNDLDVAWKIIEEYYEAARVVARDAKEDFARTYFCDGAGVWVATAESDVVGCVALRPLVTIPNSGEVKRLYVRQSHRGRGIAAALYGALEYFARESGFEWLYLDTTDEMVAAQKFYAALGYQPTRRYNDNPQATIFMRKDLRV